MLDWFRDTGLAVGITLPQVSALTGLSGSIIGTYRNHEGKSRTLFPAPRWQIDRQIKLWLLQDVLDWLFENNRDPGSRFVEPHWAWVLDEPEDPTETAPTMFGLTVLDPPLWDES